MLAEADEDIARNGVAPFESGIALLRVLHGARKIKNLL
jgi:hypothetical protein